MRVDIIQGKGNKPLRRICHEGEVYVMAPKKGSYRISLYNHSNKRRLAVVTVDGVNVLDGKDGDFEGQGYVLGPRETMEIPGWRRDDGTVAAFLFRPEEKSYANQTGRGTRNLGVVGVAVFDEKPKVRCRCPKGHHEHHHHHYNWPVFTTGYTYTTNTVNSPGSAGTVTCSTTGGDTPPAESVYFSSSVGTPRSKGAQARGVTRGVNSADSIMLYDQEPERNTLGGLDVGTGYGHEVEFETVSTSFERATDQPAAVVCLRYAVKERLQSWGVPVHRMKRPERKPGPQAFPVSRGPAVPAPPGWRG
jgi:hypothetical protein